MSCFAGKVALVTGAAGGIGGAVSASLAAAGATVVLTDCRPEPLNSRADALREQGHTVQTAVCDLTSSQAIRDLVERCETQIGPIDHLVNTAGLLRPAAGLETREQDWDDSFALNARAVFVLTQMVGQHMRERRRGAVVTVTSNAACVPRIHLAAYASSKAAAASITLSLGLELAPFGIRCNVVSPGSTNTPMLQQLNPDRPAILNGDAKSFRLGIPLARIAEPEDIASTVQFLLSDNARHIALHDLRVDGGATLDA